MTRIVALIATFFCASATAWADDELGRRASWTVPTTAEVKARLDDFLKDKTLNEAERLKIDAL
jgi:hypothetical protein